MYKATAAEKDGFENNMPSLDEGNNNLTAAYKATNKLVRIVKKIKNLATACHVVIPLPGVLFTIIYSWSISAVQLLMAMINSENLAAALLPAIILER